MQVMDHNTSQVNAAVVLHQVVCNVASFDPPPITSKLSWGRPAVPLCHVMHLSQTSKAQC